MDILINRQNNRPKLRAALFDFDGTISTLRHGWEEIMEPLMLEMIAGNTTVDESIIKEVSEYINESTGIQTYYQMKWLSEAVKRHGRNTEASEDPWWYKEEYNRRLMQYVDKRKHSILTGEKAPYDFLIRGSENLLKALRDSGIEIYVASGTDDPDVNREAEVLGFKKYFKEIAGAPVGKAECSKEMVLRKLISEKNLQGTEVLVIGDGKVEIALGREVGALTLGVASDEEKGYGLNPVKRLRLAKAGAHAIVGDFQELSNLMTWIGI